MSNPLQIQKLREGVRPWNRYIRTVRPRRIDLSGEDLSDLDLAGAYLVDAHITETKFPSAKPFEPTLSDIAKQMRATVETTLPVNFLKRYWSYRGQAKLEGDSVSILINPCRAFGKKNITYCHELAHAIHIAEGIRYEDHYGIIPGPLFDLLVHGLVYEELIRYGFTPEYLKTVFREEIRYSPNEDSRFQSVVIWLNLLLASFNKSGCQAEINTVQEEIHRKQLLEALQIAVGERTDAHNIARKCENIKNVFV